MRLGHAVAGSCILAAVMATCACGSLPGGGQQRPAAGASNPASAPPSACASGSGFALSLASERGGQPTPVRAAQWFAHHVAAPRIPDEEWREASPHDRNTLFASCPYT